jgi:hypothetical protein
MRYPIVIPVFNLQDRNSIERHSAIAEHRFVLSASRIKKVSAYLRSPSDSGALVDSPLSPRNGNNNWHCVPELAEKIQNTYAPSPSREVPGSHPIPPCLLSFPQTRRTVEITPDEKSGKGSTKFQNNPPPQGPESDLRGKYTQTLKCTHGFPRNPGNYQQQEAAAAAAAAAAVAARALSLQPKACYPGICILPHCSCGFCISPRHPREERRVVSRLPCQPTCLRLVTCR